MTETRIIVFGCVGKKTDSTRPTPIQELYRGDLWNKRMRWLRATGRTLDYVFSAQYGLVEAERDVATYDMTIKQRRAHPDYKRWAYVVMNRLAYRLQSLGPVVIELHGGNDYFEELEKALVAAKTRERGDGCRAHPDVQIERPLQGKGIGHQKQWYREETERLMGLRRAMELAGEAKYTDCTYTLTPKDRDG